MRQEFLQFLQDLANKLRNESEKARDNFFKKDGEINYNLKARGTVNMSVEEMDSAAYCIEQCIEQENSKKIIYSGGHDCDKSYCCCPHCGEDLTWVWDVDCDYKYCPYCGKPIEEDWEFRKQR